MANTRETMGEQACLDALVANTLTSFEDDGVTKVGASCLRYHTALTDVTLSQCKSVESYGLGDCTDLEVVDMLGNGTIAGNAFRSDTKLAHLLLRGASKTTLSDTNAFTSTPIGRGNGAVYVSSDLLATYKADTKWKNFWIMPLSSYPASDFGTISDSWSTIVSKCSNGDYATDYSVGDTKSIVIDGTTYYMQLVAKDSDVLASDGTTTVPTTWVMFKKLYSTTHKMNSTATTVGGWENSEMRSWLASTVFPLLPSEVQSGIKEVRKYSDYVASGETTITHDQQTSDKLWIPSAHEVSSGSAYEQSGPCYVDSTAGIFDSNDGRIKYATNGTSSQWWLRSAGSSASFTFVSSTGTFGTISSTPAYGVCLGFCI